MHARRRLPVLAALAAVTLGFLLHLVTPAQSVDLDTPGRAASFTARSDGGAHS